MLATRFIIALCPVTRIYLGNSCNDLAGHLDIKGCATTDQSRARVFYTFDAAMEVAKKVFGWGGAQRVEEIAVQVPDPQSLATEDDWHDVAAAATCAWNECADCDSVTVSARHTEDYLRSIGLKVSAEVRAGASCPATLYLADYLGNTMQLDWNPMVDGFDITEATTAADAKPRTAVCDCCARRRPQSMVHTFEDTHEDGTSSSTACEDCIVDAPAEGEEVEPTSLLANLEALAERLGGDDGALILEAVGRLAEAETATCDGCENAFPVDEVEVCGSAEHGPFGFCAACRAKDNDRSYEVDRQAMASKAVITPEEIVAAVRRTDCATVTLTDAQRERAAVLLTDALRDLIEKNLPRLIGNAQLDAAEGA